MAVKSQYPAGPVATGFGARYSSVETVDEIKFDEDI